MWEHGGTQWLETVAIARTSELVLVRVRVSAGTAWAERAFRHALRYLRARPDLDPDKVQPPV